MPRTIWSSYRTASPSLLRESRCFLRNWKATPSLLDRLTQLHLGAYGLEDFHVSEWKEQQRKGAIRGARRHGIWTARASAYRIVYAFMPRQQDYSVQGIVPRIFNDERKPLTRQLSRPVLRPMLARTPSPGLCFSSRRILSCDRRRRRSIGA